MHANNYPRVNLVISYLFNLIAVPIVTTVAVPPQINHHNSYVRAVVCLSSLFTGLLPTKLSKAIRGVL